MIDRLMNIPTSTFDKICATATQHFAVHGYDASSLNMIAETVGIRKASLYSHFQSKNELFKTVFFDACQQESQFMQQCFEQERTTEFLAGDVLGGRYCAALPQRFEQSPYLVLFLKASFIAPDYLQAEIQSAYANYLKSIGEHFVAQFKTTNPTLTAENIATFQEAYLGIIDSLHIELIYSTLAAYEKKRIAMLEVLATAIQASMI